MKNIFKKIISIFKGSSSSSSSSSSSVKVNTTEIEKQIDEVVEAYLPKCENLLKLNPSLKYWQSVLKAMSVAESSLNPYETYWEKDLGKPKGYDPISKLKYLSEGLTQVSYSDALNSYHCDFDVEGDRNKDEKDKTKTIFDVKKNIECAMKILNILVGKKGNFIYDSGNYWAVLKPSNKRHHVYLNAFNSYMK